mgnify:CR=1 FL=1
METKYETKYSDDFQSSLLNSALDAPLRSSYISRRLSLFSDDPNIRRLQASVRKDCLKIDKKMMKQRQNMLSVKNLSRRKQKLIAAVDKVNRVASALGVSREMSEQRLEMKETEERRKKDREDQLHKKVDMMLTEILSVKTAMKKNENEQTELILAKIDEIEKSRKLEEKNAQIEKTPMVKLTFTEQSQMFIESMSQDKTVFIHMQVVESAVKLGSATLKQTLNYIGMGNYETSIRARLYQFIQNWSKSLLTALKEMLLRPAGIGFKMGKMLFSIPNPSQIPDIFSDMVKDILYFVLGRMKFAFRVWSNSAFVFHIWSNLAFAFRIWYFVFGISYFVFRIGVFALGRLGFAFVAPRDLGERPKAPGGALERPTPRQGAGEGGRLLWEPCGGPAQTLGRGPGENPFEDLRGRPWGAGGPAGKFSR